MVMRERGKRKEQVQEVIKELIVNKKFFFKKKEKKYQK